MGLCRLHSTPLTVLLRTGPHFHPAPQTFTQHPTLHLQFHHRCPCPNIFREATHAPLTNRAVVPGHRPCDRLACRQTNGTAARSLCDALRDHRRGPRAFVRPLVTPWMGGMLQTHQSRYVNSWDKSPLQYWYRWQGTRLGMPLVQERRAPHQRPSRARICAVPTKAVTHQASLTTPAFAFANGCILYAFDMVVVVVVVGIPAAVLTAEAVSAVAGVVAAAAAAAAGCNSSGLLLPLPSSTTHMRKGPWFAGVRPVPEDSLITSRTLRMRNENGSGGLFGRRRAACTSA